MAHALWLALTAIYPRFICLCVIGLLHVLLFS